MPDVCTKERRELRNQLIYLVQVHQYRRDEELLRRAEQVAQLARAGSGTQQAVQRAGGAHAAGEAGQVQTAALH